MGACFVAPDLGLEDFPVADPIVAWFTASTWLVSTFSPARTRRHGHRLTVWSRSPYDAILDNDRNARSVINASSTNPTSAFTFTGTLETAQITLALEREAIFRTGWRPQPAMRSG